LIKTRVLLVLTLVAVAFSSASAAHAATTVTGGPYTGLNPAGATITVTLADTPTIAGMYIQQCQITTAGTRPTTAQCNPAAQLWITDSGQGNFKFKDTITVNVQESFGTISCSTVACGLFFRLDHTAPTNFSEDRFIPISFTGSSAALPTDELTVKIGDAALTANRPSDLAYRTPVTLSVTTKSGIAATAKAVGDNCTVTGLVVTALKGAGDCVVAVTSPGNTAYASFTANYPFTLKLGTQSVALALPAAVKVSKSIVLAPSTLVSSMGERVKITGTSAKFCTVTLAKKGYTLMAKKAGTCTLTVTAPARNGLFTAYKNSVKVTVTK
jgi:hypothetical protein